MQTVKQTRMRSRVDSVCVKVRWISRFVRSFRVRLGRVGLGLGLGLKVSASQPEYGWSLSCAPASRLQVRVKGTIRDRL